MGMGEYYTPNYVTAPAPERCGWSLDISPPYVCYLPRDHDGAHRYTREQGGLVQWYTNDLHEVTPEEALRASIADGYGIPPGFEVTRVSLSVEGEE